MFFTGDEAWVVHGNRTQWKSPFAPVPKKLMQVRSNIRDMMLVYFIVRILLISNLFI